MREGLLNIPRTVQEFLTDRTEKGQLKRAEVLSELGKFTTCATFSCGFSSVVSGIEISYVPLSVFGISTLLGSALVYWRIGIPNTERVRLLRERLNLIGNHKGKNSSPEGPSFY